MTTASSHPVIEETSLPPVKQVGPAAWAKKHLFNSWYNSLLTVVLLAAFLFIGWGLVTWAFNVAQWVVIPNNLPLFLSGLYPAARRWRVWVMLGVVVSMAGLSWGILGRNLPSLFGRNVLIGLGVICAAAIVVPLTRSSSPILIGMIVLLCAAALLGQQLGRRYPNMGKAISAGWFVSYFIILWLLGGGDLRKSMLFLVAALAVSAIVGWQLSSRVSFAAQIWRGSPLLGRLIVTGWFAAVGGCIVLWLHFGVGFRLLPLFLILVTVAAALVGAAVGWLIASPSLLEFIEKVTLFVAGFAVTYTVIRLISGAIGFDIGLQSVSTSDWGGLTLTLLLAISGIALCFPIGVIMALGRRSDLPVVKGLSIGYIELIRGVPLISILFMGQVMIPMFLPEGVRPDRIVRAIIGLTIFSSAYLAENVRAGLQAVPKGQYEAAASMGLNKPLTLGLIVLPQALKTAIPAIVGQFISLFQDTTLLGIVGLVELMGISQSILANPKYLGRYSEVYLFVAVLYWVFCYAMSLGSRKIEQQLNTDHR
ncbi:MAG: amino acid ABC transporter permease [Cyanobacteria bacterium P01_G01_bin.38]